MKKTFLFVFGLFLVNDIFAAVDSKTKSLAEEVQALQQDLINIKEQKLGGDEVGFVTLSPYAAIQATYSPYNLIVKLVDANADLQLLKQKQEIVSYRAAHNIKTPSNRPVVALSGSLEAQAWHKRDYTSGGKSDIDLTKAELDAVSNFGHWVTGAMFIQYDNSAPDAGSGARVTNSQFRIDTGFINIGNLDKTPWYGTIGQIYVPFGQYNNYMVTDPWTKILARTKDRAVVLGYSNNGWNGSVYGFKGDTYTSDRNNIINNGGANLYYGTTRNDITMGMGTSYIYNLADSIGMMSNGDGTSGHFTGFKSAEHIDHAVPAIDLRGAITYSDYNFLAEYINAVKSFKYSDLGFNGKGASPQALDLEANYNFKIMGKTSSAAIGYGRTWEALAANLPKHTAFIEFATEWLKSTIESIEYRHDWNYSKSDTATGGGVVPAYSPDGARTRNLITAQVGVYF